MPGEFIIQIRLCIFLLYFLCESFAHIYFNKFCTETGKYVAIDLSGKNLRILLLTLPGPGQEPSVVINNYMVSNAIMKGTGEQVWNFKFLFGKLTEWFFVLELVFVEK